jgi:uncharacterized membrane protein
MDPRFPVSPLQPAAGGATDVPPPDGWAVDAGRGAAWWGDAWRIFAASPWVWIAITIIFVLIMVTLGFIPVVGQIATSLLYPVLGAGALVGARAVDRGEELTVGHLFSCFGDKLMPLIILALLYMAGWFVIWLVAIALAIGTFGLGAIGGLMSGSSAQAGVALISALGIGLLVIVLVALLLAVPLIMAYWYAPALVIFSGAEPFKAMQTSFRACLRNVPPFLIYGLIGLGLGIVASIPFGLGWIVLAPVYMATAWTSYKDVFGSPP